jgi:hypothetical protein
LLIDNAKPSFSRQDDGATVAAGTSLEWIGVGLAKSSTTIKNQCF